MKAKIKFLGAAQNVTGSRYLLEARGKRILIDAGLYQERENQARNWDPFPVAPSSIDAILLTHAHLDHVGYLPKLVVDGFRGPVYSTDATADIAQIVLLDSGRLQEEDAENKQRRHEKEARQAKHPVKPLYTEKDASRCPRLFSPVRIGQPVRLGHGLEAVFREAGHILGSASIAVSVENGAAPLSIVFSGDVGRWDKPILNDPALVERADVALVESTYGDRVHKDEGSVQDLLAKAVNDTFKAGGNLLIPSFAVERAHEILYYFNELLRANRIPHILVFVDSPMAVGVTEVFRRHPEFWDEEMTKLVKSDRSPFEFPGLKMSTSVDESKSINHIRGTAAIIAGSGMCTGGRIKHHLARNLSRPECTVLFTGYQAVGTLGREIARGAQEVRIFGQSVPVRAKVSQINGFSGHADREELLRWASGPKPAPKRIFVTHGEPEASRAFAELIREKLKCRVDVPKFGEEAVLE